MKCEECGGTGKVQKWFYERTGFGKYEKVCGDVKCEWCNGTGEVEQTEQEYIQTCNTEQLARWIAKQKCDGCNDEPYDEKHGTCKYCMAKKTEQVREWLKQPHTVKE